jgi:hypothetical protein
VALKNAQLLDPAKRKAAIAAKVEKWIEEATTICGVRNLGDLAAAWREGTLGPWYRRFLEIFHRGELEIMAAKLGVYLRPAWGKSKCIATLAASRELRAALPEPIKTVSPKPTMKKPARRKAK